MIGGAVHGSGGAALGQHLAIGADEDARPGQSRGLISEGIRNQIQELSDMAKASGHKSPLRHVYASPPPGADWGEKEWGEYWNLYERAMGLEKSPFSEAPIHEKPGECGRDAHKHRVYLATTERGTLVRISHDFARQEAVSRIMEFKTGQSFTKGKHNIRAMTIASELGFPEVAEAMRLAKLHEGPPAQARMTPKERAQQERTQVSKADVAQSVSEAWQSSDSGHAFAHALRESGLILAMGDKSPVVMDQSGNVHAVSRMLAMSAKASGESAPRSQDVAARLQDVELPTLDQARERVANVPPVHDVAPIVAPEPPQPGPGVHVPVVEVVPASQDAQSPSVPDVAAPSNDGQHMPAAASTKAPSPKSGGGGGGGSAPSSQDTPSPLPSLDVGRGPGEPPGPGAHPDEIARHAAAVADYQERKEKAWLAFIRAFEAQNKPKKSGATAGGGDNGIDEKALRERASEIIREIQDATERGITLRAFYAAWDQFRGHNETSEAGLGNPGEGTPRPDEIHGPGRGNRERPDGEDGPAQRGRGADRDAGNRPGVRDDSQADGHPRSALEIALERTRIETSASVIDMADLRAAMRGPCPLEGLEGKDRKEKLDALNRELHAEFRASQREDFSEQLARERMRAHPLAQALRALPKRNLTPEQERDRTQGWADIKAAKEALILRLKEAQKANGKAAFRQFVELKSHTDSRAFALWTEMKVTAERNRKIASELSRADEKIASLKESEPQGERDPERAAKAAKSALFEPLIRAQEKLKSAIENLERTPPPAGWRKWIPWAGHAHKAAKAAVEIAHANVEAVKPHHMKIAFEESKARSAARVASDWDAGPGKELRALVHGVARIRDALESRDYTTRETLLNGGLEAALELIRKREAEEQRRREIEEARAAKRGNIYGFPDRQNSSGMEMPAPRMR